MQNIYPYSPEAMLFGGKRKIFNISLSDYRVLTPELLYDEFKEISINEIDKLNSKLYIISRIPKMRFVVERCRVGSNFNITGSLRFTDGSEAKFSASMARLWHEHADFHEKFSSAEEFAHACFKAVGSFVGLVFLPDRVRYRLLSKVDRKNSIGSKLVFKCLLSQIISGFREEHITLAPHRVANLSDLDLGNYPEVLYIGISNKGMMTRLGKHEQLQKALVLNGDQFDTLIHVFSMENKHIDVDPCEGGVVLMRGYSDVGISEDDRVLMAETVLIKHFNPEFNTHKKRTKIVKNEKIRKHLIKNGYTEVYCSLVTEGIMSRLGTKTVRCENTHHIKYNLLSR